MIVHSVSASQKIIFKSMCACCSTYAYSQRPLLAIGDVAFQTYIPASDF
jgi:hypothetical protein